MVPPPGRVQQDARDHRYELLVRQCLVFGSTTLMTGHQRDDQVETMLMRLGRASRLDGLSGMSSLIRAPPLDALNHGSHNVNLVRPLLSYDKVRHTCTHVPYEKRSNHSPSPPHCFAVARHA